MIVIEMAFAERNNFEAEIAIIIEVIEGYVIMVLLMLVIIKM